MSKILAWCVVGFAWLITCPFGGRRGGKARLRATDILLKKGWEPKLRSSGIVFRKPSAITKIGSREVRYVTHSRAASHVFDAVSEEEPDTIVWIDEFSDSPAYLWDIGANAGVFSIYAAQRSNVRVLAFEPGAGSYQALNENIELNGLDRRILAYPVALCAETKIDVLNMKNTKPGMSMHSFAAQVDQFERPINLAFRQGAVGFSIDDFVRLFAPPLPTYVKMDVDGLEPDILRGGRRMLSMPTVRSVILEVEGSEARQVGLVALMSELGFVARPKGRASYRNIIFDRPAT